MDPRTASSSDDEDSNSTEYITVKEEISDFEDEMDCYDEVERKEEYETEGEEEAENIENEYIEEKEEAEKIDKENINDEKETTVTEESKSNRRRDLFQQPFVLKYLQKHVESKEQTILTPECLKLGDEHESFVDPKSVCRLCVKHDQNIFMRLFYTNHTLTPIAKKLAHLMGTENVEEDLLPQQICLECCELVNSSYNSITRFFESHQILSEVVAEVKKKTHVFHKPNSAISVYMQVYDKSYEFCRKARSTGNENSNKTRKKESMVNSLNLNSVKCYLCKESFLPDALKDHMAGEHDCTIEYKCTSCNSIFPTLFDLNFHNSICPSALSCNDYIDNEEDENVNNDDAVSNRDMSETSEHELTSEMILKLQKVSNPTRTRKTQLLDNHCGEMVQSGPIDCRSCKYCGRVFRLSYTDDVIKAHILTHLYSSEEQQLEDIDPHNMDIVNHLTLTPCFVCSFCYMPKQTPDDLRKHLAQFCTTFAKEFNLKIRDRRRYGRTRGKPQFCKTCADGKPYRPKDYKIHLKENHPELLYFCRCCPRFFLSRNEIDFHNRIRHINQKVPEKKDKDEAQDIKKEPLLCEFCSFECKSQRGYRTHVLKTHFSSKPPKRIIKRITNRKNNSENTTLLECPICNRKKSFKDGAAGLEFHIMKHSSPNGKITCCNREYTNFVKYKIHTRSHARSWCCKLCSEVCGSSVLLQDHVASYHARCEDCSHVSKNITDHKKHRQQIHGDNVMCNPCNIMFSCKKELMVHQRQFHWEEYSAETRNKSDLPEPVLCCGKKFTKKLNLKTHTAKHQDTVCKTCGDVLKSKLALLSHNATHHRQGVECSYCNKTFCNADSLKYHMLKHTQGRQFKCACGLSFYTEADMNKHQRTRKRPCLGSMVGNQPTVVVVKADDENMEWDDETLE